MGIFDSPDPNGGVGGFLSNLFNTNGATTGNPTAGMALAGLGAGFGQGAMPSRMPVPIGSALGMAVGGMASGMKTAQDFQQGQQQLEQAKAQNQVLQSAVPLAVAKNKALEQIWGNPDLMRPMMGGGSAPLGAPPAGSGYPPVSGAPPAAGPTPLAPPGPGASAAPPANPALVATVKQFEGFAPKAHTDGKGLSVGYGSAALSPNESLTEDQATARLQGDLARSRQRVVSAAAATGVTLAPNQIDALTSFDQNTGQGPQVIAQSKGDPAAIGAAIAAGPTTMGGKVLPGLVARRQQEAGMFAGGPPAAGGAAPGGSVEPTAGDGTSTAPNATPGGANDPVAANAFATANQMEQRASALEQQINTAKFWQAQGLPVQVPVGDPQAIRQAAQQYRQLAIDRSKLITTRAGVFDPSTGGEVYRQPEHEDFIDANGRHYPGFIQPNADGTMNVMGAPPGTVGSPMTHLGPGEEEQMKELAEQHGHEERVKYDAANNALFQLDQQDQNIAALNNTGGGWSVTGPGANTRMQWAADINTAFKTLGIDPPFDPSKVASWQDASKLQTQLAFAQAKQLGSREAQQVVKMAYNATPGTENTPEGYALISGGYREMNQREIDLYQFKDQWAQAHSGNLIGAETAFNKQYTPNMYASRAISTVRPVVVSSPKEFDRLLPGTYVTDGKTIDPATGRSKVVQVPERDGSLPMPDRYRPPTAPAATQQAAPAAPPNPADAGRVPGMSYWTPQGVQKWNGQAFVPQGAAGGQ